MEPAKNENSLKNTSNRGKNIMYRQRPWTLAIWVLPKKNQPPIALASHCCIVDYTRWPISAVVTSIAMGGREIRNGFFFENYKSFSFLFSTVLNCPGFCIHIGTIILCSIVEFQKCSIIFYLICKFWANLKWLPFLCFLTEFLG